MLSNIRTDLAVKLPDWLARTGYCYMDQKETGKTVRIFALASFLNDLGSDMIYPV